MDGARWKHIERLFASAADRPAAERRAYLRAACPDDPDLQAEVAALLELDGAAGAYFRGLQSDAVPPVAPEEAESILGRVVGPWRIVRVLGRGGMGEVYLAERADGLYEQQAALKVLRPGRGAHASHDRFSTERQILASLSHPGIARLLGGGVMPRQGASSAWPYLVMEYVEGQPVDDYCAAHGLGLRERIGLVLQVCEAVQYAHQNLVVHRDLKPSNVLVGASGTVKLLDFGIAKLLQPETEGAARTTHAVMTPEYASPEQVYGAPVTTASDVYQLGLLLYEVLTGERPLRTGGLSLAEFTRVVLEQPPERPSVAVLRHDEDGASSSSPPAAGSLHRALQGDLDAIVLKALRKEPGARYASVQALRDDLERHLRGRPVEAHRGTTSYRACKFVGRHRTGVLAAAVVLAVLLGAGVFHHLRITAERDRAAAAAATSAHVTQYLLGLFRESNSLAGARAREASLALLEPAARRLDAELRDDHEVRAELYQAFGELFWSLGRYDLAGEMLQGAAALRDSFPGVPAADAAASFHAYGHFLGAMRGKPDSAVYYLRRAANLRRAQAEERDGLAQSLLMQSRFLPDGDPRREALFDEALRLLRRLHGARSAEVGLALHAYYRKGGGSIDEATIDSLRTAARILEGATGASFETAQVLEDLGFMLERAGQSAGLPPSEGLALLRRAYEMNQAVTGPHGPLVLRMGTNVGAALYRRGRLAEADRLFGHLLSTGDVPFVRESAGYGYALFWHGRTLLTLGRREEAARTLRRARAIWDAARPTGDEISQAIAASLAQAAE